MIWAEVWNLLFVRKLLKNKFLFVCVKGKFGSRNPDRHGWFSTSAAPLISASSRELARKNSVLRHTHGGGLCSLRWRKSTYRLVLDFAFRFAHFTWWHRVPRMHPIFETFCRTRRFTQRKEKTKGIGYLRDLWLYTKRTAQLLNSLLLVPNYPKQEFCQFHWLGYIKNR